MKYITLTLKNGEEVLLNLAHVISIRKLKEGCEIQMSTELLFETADTFEQITGECDF